MRALSLVAALALAAQTAAAQPATARAHPKARAAAESLSTRQFAALVGRLSEPGQYFDTDNLISNERSYLHVVGKMRELGVRGGAYVGVGPDQNFSYIAHVRPSVAFLIDIRRDNLLQHLVFKSLFEQSRNRAEYLCRLVGRRVPADVARWNDRPLDAIVAYVDSLPADSATTQGTRAAMLAAARRTGLELSADDLRTIAHIHAAFVGGGLALQFNTHGRAPRPYYPTLRQLVLERDLSGRQASYLASEDDFQFVKRLQRRNLVIPVVGDLAGSHALAAIGRAAAERGERVSVLYASNVEDYLFRDGSFGRFARTVAGLPRDHRSVIVRSYFGYFGRVAGRQHPQLVDGYNSAQLLQTMDDFAAEFARGGLQTYADVVTKGSIALR
jgi:hypothetical protein